MEKNLADLLSIRIQNDRKMKSDKVTLSLIKSMKFWINFFFLILFCFSFLWALDSEDLEKVKSLKETIEKSDRYRLQPLDLFDGDMHWSIFHGSSYLESVKFTSKIPKSEAYRLESELYYNPESPFKAKAMQIHSNIEIPGRDKVFLKPELVKPLGIGNPVRIFFWVYSNNYDINMKIIISQRKSPDIVVDFGVLKFNGWRRMDAKVTNYKPPDRLNLPKSSKFELKGILLESSVSQPKGNFFIFFDQMGILMEKPETYPGSEVPDGWELY
ncbi:MAG: hypothetical protein KBA66_20900 [Leptospiraceae bacterium]|nr:hypothetical protein [Leptospiraceae bacterium]